MEYSDFQKRYLLPKSEIDALDNAFNDVVKSAKDSFTTSFKTDLVAEIFAPNPLTGWPNNALSLVLNAKTAPEVQEFVKSHLLVVHPLKGGAPDDDTALETVIPRSSQYGEEIDEFNNSLMNFIEKYNDEYESSKVIE